MIKIDNKVGRLVEVRASVPLSLGELAQFKTELIEIMQRLGRKFVACVDLRQLRILPQPQTEAIQKIFLTDNPMLERSAILLPEKSLALSLQFERLICEAKNPVRKSFHDPEEAVSWLRNTLALSEAIRLKVFLGEPALEDSFKPR
jgi:hypothetical protein